MHEVVNMLTALIGSIYTMHVCRNILHSVNNWNTAYVWKMGKSREERSPVLSISVLCLREARA